MSNREELTEGTQIDNRYLIQRILGQGGLGRTYLAFDTHRFNEPCVLKEFAPWETGDLEFAKARDLFKREAKILHQIQHPQIPKFLACFEGQGRLFLVQEYVKGKTYSQLLKQRQKQGGVFYEPEIIQWSIDLLPVIDYIHSCGIIHRDISPDNIMQPDRGSLPVLIDFGVGKLTKSLDRYEGDPDSDINNRSFVGKMSFVGKIGYASREQIGMGICSPASDLYSVGVTAIVLLTGKEPMQLMSRDSLDWEWRKCANVSDAFAAILDKLIADRPRNRYQLATEVLSDLKQLVSLRSEPSNQAVSQHSDASVNLCPDETIISPPITSDISQTFSPETAAIDPNETICLTPELSPKAKDLDETISALPEPSVNVSQQYLPTDSQQSSSAFMPQETALIKGDLQKQPIKRSIPPLDPNFIKFCQKELAYAIGPIANLIVPEVLEKNPAISARQLASILESYIADSQQAQRFKQRLGFD
jgi:serine/threonine-protein kinase